MSQPPPIKNSNEPIWPLVVEDMKKRNEIGIERYGTPLQKFNGRNSLQDSFEEALDLCAYLKQSIEERKVIIGFLKEIATCSCGKDFSDYSYKAYELLTFLGET